MQTFFGILLSAAAVAAKRPKWNELQGYSFEQYLVDLGKGYESEELRAKRKAAFEKNLAKIKTLNMKPGMTWRAGVNQFTDWTDEELKNYNRAKRSFPKKKDMVAVHGAPAADAPPLPRDVDWRKRGAVGPVRDQGQCGSCWAHSAAETISSHFNILTGTTTVLSVGQIADCMPFSVGNGCDGGYPSMVFQHLQKLSQSNQGPQVLQSLTEEWAYPYTTEDFFWGTGTNQNVNCTVDICHSTCKDISQYWKTSEYGNPVMNAAGVSGVGTVNADSPTGSPAAMKAMQDIGPMTVLVAAYDWFYYESGVYQNNASATVSHEWELDHAVQMVGYGYDQELNANYWIVRNSWSTGWGEEGYIRLWRPQEGQEEPCSPWFQYDGTSYRNCGTSGVLSELVYPVVFKANVTVPS